MWFFMLAVPVLALDPARSLFQFNCRNWTRQNGLPTDKINTIAQTKDGYLWLGTQDGLVRFDGLEFKDLPITLPAAQSHEVRMLITSHDGGLRFALGNGGFGSYDGHSFSPVGDSLWRQPNMEANTILEARDGSLWTSANEGLGHWVPQNSNGSFFWGYTNTLGIVLSFCEDASGRIWMGTTEQGLFYWRDGKLNAVPEEPVLKKNIFALAAEGTNRIWVGTDSGLRYCADGRVRNFSGFWLGSQNLAGGPARHFVGRHHGQRTGPLRQRKIRVSHQSGRLEQRRRDFPFRRRRGELVGGHARWVEPVVGFEDPHLFLDGWPATRFSPFGGGLPQRRIVGRRRQWSVLPRWP